MTDDYLNDLALAGYFVTKEADGKIIIEGTSKNSVDFVIEDDFGIFWLYEFTGINYYALDAFNDIEVALERAKSL